jgi:hypothetical protein
VGDYAMYAVWWLDAPAGEEALTVGTDALATAFLAACFWWDETDRRFIRCSLTVEADDFDAAGRQLKRCLSQLQLRGLPGTIAFMEGENDTNLARWEPDDPDGYVSAKTQVKVSRRHRARTDPEDFRIAALRVARRILDGEPEAAWEIELDHLWAVHWDLPNDFLCREKLPLQEFFYMYGQWEQWAEKPDDPDWTPKYRRYIRQFASKLVALWGDKTDPDRV